jgi:phosphoribosylaminoimidazole-succinocarboxamide synthase
MERGKVRDVYDGGEHLFLVATNRLSAFDRQVGVIPHRGQVLTQLSAWWFDQTKDIVANHMIGVIGPNVMVVRKCEMLPLEMVIRGYNTGVTKTSIWHRYCRGQRDFGGVILPEGMLKNDQLPQPVLDPTTKAHEGHDEARTKAEIVAQGIMGLEEYGEVEQISLALFSRGQELARRAGLILVDTKYEFGRGPGGELMLADELHTPDSSRFWDLGPYRGGRIENYDKEFARLYLAGLGYTGEGEVPQLPKEIVDEVRRRYIEVYERLTGAEFVPEDDDPQRVQREIERWQSA